MSTMNFSRIGLLGFTFLVFLSLRVGAEGVLNVMNLPEGEPTVELRKELQLNITSIGDIGVTSAKCSGEIYSKGKTKTLRKGICWNTKGNPTVADNKKVFEGSAKEFQTELSGLKKGTVYHIRPFAKVGSMFIYGQQESFATNSLVNGVPVEMKYIEGGEFQMGCTNESHRCYADEYPVHTVTVGSFQMSVYEVTTKQYCAFLNERGVDADGNYKGISYIDVNDSDCPLKSSSNQGFSPKSGKANYPVTEVTWKGAKAFCEWIGGRLPTEAEWEYAARGGKYSKNYKYAGADNIDYVAWYSGNSDKECHPVGQKAPNELGLYDMSGNVWEWCIDWYGFYEDGAKDNPQGASEGSERILRGGSMNMDDWNCRITNRSSKSPEFTYNYFGFRCVIPGN